MRHWWLSVKIGTLVLAWWPFGMRTMVDHSANKSYGFLIGKSDQ